MMAEPNDNLEKLAAERKEHNPFEKIDELEKEFKLDETPDLSIEDYAETMTDDPIGTLRLTEKYLFDNQEPR